MNAPTRHRGPEESVRALVCERFGPAEQLRFGELPAPQPGPHDVAIAVSTAGVSYVDTLVIQDRHQNKHELPFAPGMEVAGVVTAVGAEVTTHSIGQRVMALVYDGAYAEQAVAPATEAFALPSAVPDEVGAVLVGGYLTAHAALHWQGNLARNEWVLVLGAAGAVGLAAIQVAKAMGARVIAGASSDERLDVARAAGADVTVNYATDPNAVRVAATNHTDGEGVNVVYDPVAGALYEPSFRSLGWGGRYLIVGFAGGEIPKFPANHLLVKNRSAVGVALMYFRKRRPDLLKRSAEQLMAWCEAGMLSPPIANRIALEQVPAALDDLANRRLVGKVVTTI
ncbi:MAG: NADPH:quinone oxidoreductase family protein [Pseudomonadota bacterium]